MKENEVRPFLIRLAENCFHSGIPEEDAVRWTMIYRDLKFFEEEIRETIHTAYLLSRNFGKKFSIPQEQLMAVKTDEFMKRRYEFRRNMLTGDVEFRARGSYYIRFAPVTDTVLNTIGLNAQSEGLALWDRDVKRYVYSDRAPVFHPLDDFLDHLRTASSSGIPEWKQFSANRIRKGLTSFPSSKPPVLSNASSTQALYKREIIWLRS